MKLQCLVAGCRQPTTAAGWHAEALRPSTRFPLQLRPLLTRRAGSLEHHYHQDAQHSPRYRADEAKGACSSNAQLAHSRHTISAQHAQGTALRTAQSAHNRGRAASAQHDQHSQNTAGLAPARPPNGLRDQLARLITAATCSPNWAASGAHHLMQLQAMCTIPLTYKALVCC
jgi:hypothetical protein